MFVFACGGPPQPTKEVTTLPSASASVAVVPAIDLSPVAMPSSVVVLIHAAHIGASADMVSEWAGQQLEVDQALGEMVGEKLAKLVDLDSPADMTITAEDRGGRREPDARFAVSLPVKDFEGAKSQLQGEYGLLPISNGAFEISRSGKHHRDGDSDFRSCALAPSGHGGRLVCSKDATARDAVLPFLTRGTSNLASLKSDLHIDARPGPFRELVRRERSSITQSGARFMGGGRDLRVAWESAVADLCDSFLDVERASLDATIDAKQGMADLKISAKGSQGLLTRVLSAHPERAEPPPAAFLRLPDDADIALFAHGLDADQIAGPRTQLIAATEAQLAQEDKLTPGDRKAFVDALAHTIDLFTMPVVYARGVDFAKAVPAVSGLTEASDASKIRAGIEQAAGWDVFGVEGAPDKIAAVFKEWTAAIGRPTVASQMKDTKWRVAGASRNAPAGSVHLTLIHEIEDIDFQTRGPNGQPKKRPPIVITMHTLIVPDGPRAWIVNALDETTAVNKARAIMASAPGGAGTLATRAGLDALKNARLNAGGFITPRGAGLGMPMWWMFTWNPRYKISNDPLVGVSSQSQYTTPIIFTAAESASNDEKSLTIGLRVSRSALADALAVAPHLFH